MKVFSSVGDGVFAPGCQEGCRAQSGEFPKVPDEVRLIGIAARRRKGRPFDCPASLDGLHDVLKPSHAAEEELRAQANFVPEDLDEAFRREPDVARNCTDRGCIRDPLELLDREGHIGVASTAAY